MRRHFREMLGIPPAINPEIGGHGQMYHKSATPSKAYTSYRAGERASQNKTTKRKYSTSTLKKRYSGSSGGGSSYKPKRRASSGGGGYRPAPVVANRSGRYSKPVAPPVAKPGAVPKIASIEDWLGSETMYKNQIRNFDKAFGDFNADLNLRKGRVNTDFTQSEKTLKDQRVSDLETLKNDFASRGLLTSGLYANELGDYENEFNQQLANLTRGRTESLSNIGRELSNFQSEQNLAKQRAREEAIRRRAAKYGLG